jgi:Na+/H+-dicarboxylate symporter/ABC-type amino acid transport substrate-binding protein
MSTAARPANALFRRIVAGLVIGAAAGTVLGELVAPLRIVADAFIKLLQVNVLPYVLGSLIAGLGGRPAAESRRMAGRAGRILVPIWLSTLGIVFVSALALPYFRGESLFSLDTAPARGINWVELYIPSNVFHSLANNMIPAVVLFGILAGLALGQMRGERKRALLETVDAFNEAMGRISRMIVQLTPYGLCAIAAVTAGEIRFAEFIRLQMWIVLYAGTALLMTFWVLPGLVMMLTPVKYGRFLDSLRSALLMAFAAGDAFVGLPLIAESVKDAMHQNGVEREDADATIGVVMPLLYNFPGVGKVLTLGFIPFAAWFNGSPLELKQYATLLPAGFLSLFGNINAAIPFLLDLMKLPADLMSLFAASSVINSRVGGLTGAMHNAALSLLVAMALTIGLRWDMRRFWQFVGVTVVTLGIFLGGTRAVFTWVLPPAPGGVAAVSIALRGPLVPAVMADANRATPSAAPVAGQRKREILARGVLRVGYLADAMPWSFVAADGQVDGHDIEAMHALAAGLGVTLEFIAADRASVASDLSAGRYDILAGGYVAAMSRAVTMELSRPYAQIPIGFLVRDFDRARFTDVDSFDGRGLHVAARPVDGGLDWLKRQWPAATVEPFENLNDVIDRSDIQAIMVPLARAFYWSRVRPEFSAVAPDKKVGDVLMVYALPAGELEWRNVVDVWIDTRRADGSLDDAYGYWILGKALLKQEPRWSVLRNVLGWGK